MWVERLPRILLVEAEYQLAMRVAQSQWLRDLLTELVEGTIHGIDGSRRMHETGEVPPELEELNQQARRGWDENAATASMTARHSATPVHGAGTPRTEVATSTTSPAVRQNPAIMRPNQIVCRAPSRGTGPRTPVQQRGVIQRASSPATRSLQSPPPPSRRAGLVKTYPAPGKHPRIRALDGLDLTVAPGTIYALVGPNEAGKSTTVKILTTLAIADEGTATVEGIDVRADPAGRAAPIGVVGQRSGADPAATGRENLVLQGHLYGRPPRPPNRADELLEPFRADRGRRPLRPRYSGGMQRHLDVALGLVHRPQVLFLDEPTTGLDPEARTAMWDEITRLAEYDQVTVLLTTHYLDEADRLAGRWPSSTEAGWSPRASRKARAGTWG